MKEPRPILPMSLSEFAYMHNVPPSTVSAQMRRGFCHWPRKMCDGAEKDPAYMCWVAMRQRCTNPKHVSYPRYGGNGIAVCGRWRDFRLFLKDVGPRPSLGHSLDRIDCAGNYEPGNVRWATRSEQEKNKRPRNMKDLDKGT